MASKKPKLTEKQHRLLLELYQERKGPLTDDVEKWLSNLPLREACKLIDAWLPKKAKPKSKPKWVAPALYIPDNPNPNANYLRQAANIAREMRKKLEADGH